MSRDLKHSGKERLKYGICLNDECSMCKSKEIQSVPMRKDLICTECGKELRECPPPKKKGKLPTKVIAVITVIALIVLIICTIFVMGGKDDSVKEDIVKEVSVIEEIVATEVMDDLDKKEKEEVIIADNRKTSASSELTLSYGKYSGAIKNGYPHGQGKLTYTKARIINRNDMKAREAKPGNYIIGEFYNGFVVYGKLYDADGNLLSSLNFGVSNEDNYDSK